MRHSIQDGSAPGKEGVSGRLCVPHVVQTPEKEAEERERELSVCVCVVGIANIYLIARTNERREAASLALARKKIYCCASVARSRVKLSLGFLPAAAAGRPG